MKVSDIDSKRMMLRLEQGKGKKDLFAMLSPQLLELLRDGRRAGQRTSRMDATRRAPSQHVTSS